MAETLAMQYDAGACGVIQIMCRDRRVPTPNTRMNICGNSGDQPGTACTMLSHQVGHAFGINPGGSTSSAQWLEHDLGHSPDYIVDTTLSHNRQPRGAPYQLDIMAIHALYQTVD